MVSRYGMRGGCSVASTPYLRLRRSSATSRCTSPSPWTSTSLVTGSRSAVNAMSSSARRLRPLVILSSSPLLLATMAAAYDAGGGTIGGCVIGASFAHSVSPVSVCVSLVTTPMSPAITSGTVTIALPLGWPSCAKRSSTPRRTVTGWLSPRMDPRRTLKYETLPNVSTVVLNTCAQSFPAGSHAISASLPLASTPLCTRSAGAGRYRTSESSNSAAPCSLLAAAHTTGTSMPFAVAACRAARTSSSVSSVPSRYFSSSASSDSAAASMSAECARSISAVMASGTGVSLARPRSSNVYPRSSTRST